MRLLALPLLVVVLVVLALGPACDRKPITWEGVPPGVGLRCTWSYQQRTGYNHDSDDLRTCVGTDRLTYTCVLDGRTRTMHCGRAGVTP